MTKKEISRQLIKSKCEELFDSGKNILCEFATSVVQLKIFLSE